ncbi:unnamed protein product [Nezara viridula]|uniref:Uncharacterized protein n=1 Tax=Nezara viridula TaxID=85310 RepID=A0A9P0H4Z3_NEZVI|nr:unnamed protein product [Nezara viridula]
MTPEIRGHWVSAGSVSGGPLPVFRARYILAAEGYSSRSFIRFLTAPGTEDVEGSRRDQNDYVVETRSGHRAAETLTKLSTVVNSLI